MSNENYTDSSYSHYLAHTYTLLIQVQPGAFSYAIVNYNNLLASAQNCPLDELAHPKRLSDLLSANYRKVIIGLPATALTLVPKALYHSSKAGEYARFLDVKEHDKVFAQPLDDQNNIIYKTTGDIASAVERFGFANTVYTCQGWIKRIEKDHNSDNNLYTEISSDSVCFLYLSNGLLRFYNAFVYKNEDELAYFATLVTSELGLNPQSVTLVLSGEIKPDDNKMKRLADFFPKSEINGLKVLNLPEHIASHTILSLAALSLCE